MHLASLGATSLAARNLCELFFVSHSYQLQAKNQILLESLLKKKSRKKKKICNKFSKSRNGKKISGFWKKNRENQPQTNKVRNQNNYEYHLLNFWAKGAVEKSFF